MDIDSIFRKYPFTIESDKQIIMDYLKCQYNGDIDHILNRWPLLSSEDKNLIRDRKCMLLVPAILISDAMNKLQNRGAYNGTEQTKFVDLLPLNDSSFQQSSSPLSGGHLMTTDREMEINRIFRRNPLIFPREKQIIAEYLKCQYHGNIDQVLDKSIIIQEDKNAIKNRTCLIPISALMLASLSKKLKEKKTQLGITKKSVLHPSLISHASIPPSVPPGAPSLPIPLPGVPPQTIPVIVPSIVSDQCSQLVNTIKQSQDKLKEANLKIENLSKLEKYDNVTLSNELNELMNIIGSNYELMDTIVNDANVCDDTTRVSIMSIAKDMTLLIGCNNLYTISSRLDKTSSNLNNLTKIKDMLQIIRQDCNTEIGKLNEIISSLVKPSEKPVEQRAGTFYIPYVNESQDQLNDKGYQYTNYDLYNYDCKKIKKANRFYSYLLDHLNRIMRNGPDLIKLENVTPYYSSWNRIACDNLQNEKFIDFWFENPQNIKGTQINIKNFYRLSNDERFNDKLSTYDTIVKYYGKKPDSIPEYLPLDKSVTFDELFNKIIDSLKSVSDLKNKRAWILKDATGSVGSSMYGLYVEFKNNELDIETMKNKLFNEIYETLQNETYTISGKKYSTSELIQYYINNGKSEIDAKKNIINIQIKSGFSGEAKWFLNEFVDSIRTPQNNIISTEVPEITPDHWALIKNRRLKFRAYFIPIIEYHPNKNFEPITYGWLYSTLDTDFLPFNKEAQDVNEIMYNPNAIISNFTSGALQNHLCTSESCVPRNFDDILVKKMFGDKYDNIMGQIVEICKNLIIPSFKLDCDNKPINLSAEIKDHFKKTGESIKCFNITALDIIVDNSYNAKFLEINTSPVVQKYYPPSVYSGLYNLCFENYLYDYMVFLNENDKNFIINKNKNTNMKGAHSLQTPFSNVQEAKLTSIFYKN